MELTNDQKIEIVNQHLRNLAYEQYNSELSLQEANAVAQPDLANLGHLENQISDIDAKVASLQATLASLNPAITTTTK